MRHTRQHQKAQFPPNADIVHFLVGNKSGLALQSISLIVLVSIPSGFTAPSPATGNGLPGKRPHGNRIRAWGLSASRSAPILHRISSLDGVRATGEYTSPLSGLYIQQKHNWETTRRTVSLQGSEEEKCHTIVPLGHIYSRLNGERLQSGQDHTDRLKGL